MGADSQDRNVTNETLCRAMLFSGKSLVLVPKTEQSQRLLGGGRWLLIATDEGLNPHRRSTPNSGFLLRGVLRKNSIRTQSRK